MKLILRWKILSITIFLILSNQAFAQWLIDSPRRSDRSLLSALFAPTPSLPGGENVWSPDMSTVLVSGFVGFNDNKNLGDFSATCDCSFEGKRILNVGLAVGGDITYVFSREWGVIAKLYYDDKHTSETLERDINTPIKYGQQVIIRPVRYEEKAKVTLSYLTFGMFMRYQPRLQRWYIFAGPTASTNLTSKVEQTSTILTDELTYIEGGNTERIVSQDPIKDVKKIRAEGMAGIGYEYMLGPRLFLSPEIQFAFPITTVSSDPDWKVMTVRLAVGIKYEAF